MTKAYIVWHPDGKSGIIVKDKQVAYEAKKGSASNCYDKDGDKIEIAQKFCNITEDYGYCKIQEIDIEI